MIKHIVMWRFQENAGGHSKTDNLKAAKEALDTLPSKILKIQDYQVGINFVESDAAYDMVLISAFQSKDDLDAYRAHPDHVAVAQFVKSIVYERATVDYEY